MRKPLVCLCLTGKTIDEDVRIAEEYIRYIDMVELRADCLEEDERLNIRDFPSLVKVPCLLTIRRVADGGKYEEGEASRSMLFARALAFADEDKRKNFAYVDFEDDFIVPGLQDAALAFGTRIIRSFHDMNNPVKNIAQRLSKMRMTGFEIPKIAFMPKSLSDITDLFKEASALSGTEQIICAMSAFGLPTRVLAQRFNSYLSFTSPAELMENVKELGHVDPVSLSSLYRFRSIDSETRLFGITGFPLVATSSPKIHNTIFGENEMNAVYVPFKAEKAEEAFEFANTMGVCGFSVTVPHKETIIPLLDSVDKGVQEMGACNTVVREDGKWLGFNTDCIGFELAIKEFTGRDSLSGMKVSVIGAGGAAKAIVYALRNLGADACIFNRTSVKARKLAEKVGFNYSGLGSDCIMKLQNYSDLIVQTTSKGMNSTDEPNETNDPIWFYDFTGNELLYDIVYEPNVTPVMKRAAAAGCRVANGLSMLRYQGEEQARIFRKAYEKSFDD